MCAQMSFRDEFGDSTSKVLGSIMMSVSLSFEVKDYDISRAYFQGTKEKETHSHLIRVCVEHNAELRKTNAALCRGKHNAALFYNPNQDARMAMQGDFDGFKHADIQIQRRSERHGRTPGFKYSNVNDLVTSDLTNIRREMGDGRRSLILNEIDATRCEFVGSRQVGFC